MNAENFQGMEKAPVSSNSRTCYAGAFPRSSKTSSLGSQSSRRISLDHVTDCSELGSRKWPNPICGISPAAASFRHGGFCQWLGWLAVCSQWRFAFSCRSCVHVLRAGADRAGFCHGVFVAKVSLVNGRDGVQLYGLVTRKVITIRGNLRKSNRAASHASTVYSLFLKVFKRLIYPINVSAPLKALTGGVPC